MKPTPNLTFNVYKDVDGNLRFNTYDFKERRRLRQQGPVGHEVDIFIILDADSWNFPTYIFALQRGEKRLYFNASVEQTHNDLRLNIVAGESLNGHKASHVADVFRPVRLAEVTTFDRATFGTKSNLEAFLKTAKNGLLTTEWLKEGDVIEFFRISS